MRRNLEFKNFSPSPRLRELNAARKLYHVSLTCDVPGRMLAAQEERHDAEEAVREVFVEIERQLEKHKEKLSHSSLYKRPRLAAKLGARVEALHYTGEEVERLTAAFPRPCAPRACA